MVEAPRPFAPLRRLSRQLRAQRLVRNNALLFSANIGAGFFTYIFHFALGRLLGPASYGIVAAAVSAIYLLTLPSLIIQLVSARFTSVASAQQEHLALWPLARMLTLVSLGIGLVAGLIIWLASEVVARFLQLSGNRVVAVLAVSTLLGMLVSTNRGVLQGLQRFGALSVNLLVDSFSRLVVAVGLTLSGLGAAGAVVGVMAGPAIAYLQSLPSVLRLPRGRTPRVISGAKVARYAGPAAAAVIGITYLFNIDVVLARHYLPPHAAGIYAAGAVLARAAYFVGTTIAAVMFPEVASRHARDEEHFHVVDLSFLCLAAVSLALVTAYAIAPGLVLLPYGSQFADARPFLWVFAVALSLLSLSNLLVNYFLSVDNLRFAVPLLTAGVLETLLMVQFHRDLTQMISMLLISNGALLAVLGLLYLVDRWRTG